MVKVIWTLEAIEDLNEIGDYIEYEGYPLRAQKVVSYLFESVERLSQFPFLGRKIPKYYRRDVRELIRMDYRISYQIVYLSVIYILAVDHSSMDERNLSLLSEQ